MEKIKVYVGCGLTHAPKRFKAQIENFKNELRKIPWIIVLDFVTKNSISENPDCLHIYTNDIHDCVGNAEALIGELTYPSTGLGWELGAAVEKHSLRTLMCMKRNKLVSFLPQGAPLHTQNHHVSINMYEKSIMELFDYFVNELKKVYIAFNQTK